MSLSIGVVDRLAAHSPSHGDRSKVVELAVKRYLDKVDRKKARGEPVEPLRTRKSMRYEDGLMKFRGRL